MPDRICVIPDCEKPTRTKRGPGYCRMHGGRLERHGDPLKVIRKPARKRVVTDQGYVSIHEPDHPLADKRLGRVYEHRKVLFDAIGGDSHSCHWCGREVHWFATGDQMPLHVDHLDWERQNNDLANLAPVCNPCNTGRLKVIRKGEALHSARLKNEDVLEIRASHLTYRELAAIYSVSINHIGRVRRGEQWKHLPIEGKAG